MATTARRDGDDWVISGTKLWITGAHHANVLLVAARIDDGDAKSSTGMFLVDRAVSPFKTNPIKMLGLRAPSHCEVVLDDVRVPSRARIGADSVGRRRVSHMLRMFSVVAALKTLGIAQHAFDLALEYSKVRKQFGRPIAGFQLVQEMLVNMATEIALGRLMTYRTLALFQNGANNSDINVAGSMAKMYCTEMAVRVASLGVRVHGAMGLCLESQAQRLLRDAQMFTIAGGTLQIQTLIIGRELTGLSALR